MHWNLNIYTFINSIIIRRNEVVKCEWTPWQRTVIRLYYKQKGRGLQRVSFLSLLVKKIDRQAWNTVAVNLFCYHRFSSEKSSPWPQWSDGLHQRSAPEGRGWRWAVQESPTDSVDIPPFAFEAPGGFYQKSFPPGISASLHVEEESATRDRKAWPPILQSAPYF